MGNFAENLYLGKRVLPSYFDSRDDFLTSTCNTHVKQK